jgi:hypothetical protein
MATSKLINRYKSVGDHLLLTPKTFVIFGNIENDDLLLIGINKSTTSPCLYYKEEKQKLNSDKCLDLLNKVEMLSKSSAYAMLTLTDDTIRLIKDTIGKLNATHIRLYDYENKLRISVFDYRNYIQSARIDRKTSQKILYLDLDSRITQSFSFTIDASSFGKLINQDYLVRIGINNICEFSPLKDEVKYLLRDQEVIEPVTTFFSDRLACRISLSLDPKS